MNAALFPGGAAEVPWPTTDTRPQGSDAPVPPAAQPAPAPVRPLRELRDQWIDGARGRVRQRPLACIAGALALGVVIARLLR